MEKDKILICRLCLEICKNDFKLVIDSTKEMLNSLLLNTDLSVSREPVLCYNCLDKLVECFNFKTDYLKGGHITMKPKIRINADAPDICNIVNSNDICCSCMELINRETSIVLTNQEKNVTTMLEKYFPELVLNGIMDTACITCYESVRNRLAFISSCLATEEKIKEYCEVEGTDSRGQVELSSVLHFMSKSQLRNNIHSNFIAVKIEKDCEEREDGYKAKVKNEELVEIEEVGIDCIQNKELDIKTEQSDDTRFAVQTMYRNNATQKSAMEVTVFKCETCNYRSKQEEELSDHMLSHKDLSEVTVYKCEICTYQTRRKYYFSLHTLTHKHPSEVTMYKCEICTYQSRHKRNLSDHMLIHKDASEVTMYKCETCPYQSRHKGSLPLHMLTHKNPSEVIMYKCEKCTYQTKHKRNLSAHVLTHRHPSQIPMHKCETCMYQSRQKRSLREHMLTHRDPSEVLMFRCEICTFQSRRKGNLAEHMLTHKDASEVIMFKCEICPYQSRRKSNLSLHMLTHKSLSEVMLYKCEVCAYQSKRKGNLSAHMLTHKSNCKGHLSKDP